MTEKLTVIDDARTLDGPLTKAERAALDASEAVIEENLGVWVNVSNAFLEIAEKRLYRGTHPSFEAYVAERWGLSRSHGHRIVVLGRVRMSPIGDKIRNEAQARELASLLDDPKLLERVVARAEELHRDKPLTARALRQARAELALPPADAKRAREVYEAAEWSRELVDEWQEDAARWIKLIVDGLSPSDWAWGLEQLGDKRNGMARLKAAQKAVIFDAPLTDEVLYFIREAPKITGESVTATFSGFLQIEGAIDPLSSVLVEGFREQEGADLVRQAVADQVAELSRRMAEVVTAAAEAPTLPPPEWTPQEVEAARSKWSHMLAMKGTRKWPSGPLLDTTQFIASALGQLARRMEEKITSGKEDR